jgi:hypothetical protein
MLDRSASPTRRARVCTLLGLAAAAVLGLVPAGAAGTATAASEQEVPVALTFTGTGTFSATNSAETAEPDHADDQLSWSITYPGVISSDGALSFQAPSSGADESLGSYHFTATKLGGGSADCTGSLPPAPGAPLPTATLTDGMLDVQGITSVDGADADSAITCQGTSGGGDPEDDSSEAANLAGAFEPYLPMVLEADVPAPSADQLESTSYSKSVSEADAPVPLPASCASEYGWSDPNECTMSLSWSGTIGITLDCSRPGVSKNPTFPICITKQDKADAHDAKDFEDRDMQAQLGAQGKCIGRMRGGCWVFSPVIYYDMHEAAVEQEIVDDPPDSSFKLVAKAHPLRLPDQAMLSHQLPKVAALLGDYARIAGLQQALVTARNRAAGAYLASSDGNTAAGAYVATQDRAMVNFAGTAAHLLAGQHARALSAAAELRAMASQIHGRGSNRAISAIRSLASSLVSKRAQDADRLAGAALTGIAG